MKCVFRSDGMRIAQVSPLYESVPPKYYGGTERVVSYLVEELVDQGHEVTLFASADSVTKANLIPASPQSLRLDSSCVDQLAYHVLMLESVLKQADQFDLIHFHIDYLHYPFSRRCSFANVTTLHGRLDIPDLLPLYKEFSDIPVVSISFAQRLPLPWANWAGNVYHGIPSDLHSFRPNPGKYLVFLGRISPEKRVDRAIEIATRVGIPLKIAAKVSQADRPYFESIKHMFDNPLIEFLGEVGEVEKDKLLGDALALLFPIDWPEPFGLVMIEAMACGTPVIAFKNGSIPEVLKDGLTGAIVESVDDAVRSIEKISSLNRKDIRKVFEERFTAARMAHDYAAVYRKLIEGEGDRAHERTVATNDR